MSNGSEKKRKPVFGLQMQRERIRMRMAAVFLVMSVFAFSACGSDEEKGSGTLFFDDFSYSGVEDAEFTAFGWTARSEDGAPASKQAPFLLRE